MESEEIHLRYNQPLRVTGATRIQCTAGTLWLTRTGAGEDIFLLPGETFTLDWSGTAVVEALGETAGGAHITLTPPRCRSRRFLSAVWRFLLSYADGRASRYEGIYL